MTVREIGIEPVQEERRKRCINFLEKLLEQAKKGPGYESIFMVMTYPDVTSVHHAWTGCGDTVDMVGRLEHLKFELLADMRERDMPEPARPGDGG